MTVKAIKLKESRLPEKTALYEIRYSRDIAVEEEQKDGSLDQVTLEYHVGADEIGYFAKEYRPDNVPEKGAKVIDITAVMLNHAEKSGRWHLYDIKDTLAGEDTVVTLYNQWNAGLQYLRYNILDRVPEFSMVPDLGVITRTYDEEKMKHIRNKYQGLCNEIIKSRNKLTLLQQKKRIDIGKYRAKLKAAQAILDKSFQTEGNNATYDIHIKLLQKENQAYKMRFPV